jgi:hypothetical protein
MPAGAFILGDETRGVMGRVNRLLALAGADQPRTNLPLISWAERIGLCLLLAGLTITLTSTHALASFHAAMERVVQALT